MEEQTLTSGYLSSVVDGPHKMVQVFTTCGEVGAHGFGSETNHFRSFTLTLGHPKTEVGGKILNKTKINPITTPNDVTTRAK